MYPSLSVSIRCIRLYPCPNPKIRVHPLYPSLSVSQPKNPCPSVVSVSIRVPTPKIRVHPLYPSISVSQPKNPCPSVSHIRVHPCPLVQSVSIRVHPCPISVFIRVPSTPPLLSRTRRCLLCATHKIRQLSSYYRRVLIPRRQLPASRTPCDQYNSRLLCGL